MTNEEFQRIVLEELKGIKEDVGGLKEGQEEIKKQLNSITEQTADLTEFREETTSKLDTLMGESEILQEIVGTHEVSIRSIKRNIV